MGGAAIVAFVVVKITKSILLKEKSNDE